MRALRAWFRRLAGYAHAEKSDREFTQELQTHLRMHIEDNLRSGMSPEEARRAALIKLGGVEATRENVRDRRRLPLLDALSQDVRFGARMLRKNPGFAAGTILILALGIGANTLLFSAARAVFLRPLPYPDASRLMFVSRAYPGFPQGGGNFTYPASRDLAELNHSFDVFAVTQSYGALALTEGAEPVRVAINYVTPSYLQLLGAQVRLGRIFRPEENRYGSGDFVIVLSHGFWQRQFGGAPDIVGRSIHLNQKAFTVVGVLAEDFHDAPAQQDFDAPTVEAWIPLGLSEQLTGLVGVSDRAKAILWGLGHLKDGVTPEQAGKDIAAIGPQLAKTYPDTDRGFGMVARPLKDVLYGQYFTPVRLLLSGSAFILLIGCANVANLLVARMIARQREFAVRCALGASSGRLVRQMLIENGLLTALAGIVGLLTAYWGVRAVQPWAAEHLSPLIRVEMDIPVLIASLAFSGLTGLVFGVGPALLSSRADVREALSRAGKQGTGLGRRRAARVLVVVEVGMAVVLLVGAGLLLKSFGRLTSAGLGFETKNLLVMRLDLRSQRYAQPEVRTQFVRSLEHALHPLPGVTSVTIWGPSMLGQATWVINAIAEGRDASDPRNILMANRHSTNPGGLENLGIAIHRGRDISPQDTSAMPLVAVVSESFARHVWPGEEAVGKRLRPENGKEWITVIGVAADARHAQRFNMQDASIGIPPSGIGPQYDVYLPYEQRPNNAVVLNLRVQGDVASVTRELRSAVLTLDPTLPLYDVALLDDRLAQQEQASRSLAAVTGAYAVLALFLAAFGLFAVLAQMVRRRTQEIGIRMAMGAAPGSVLRMILAEGMGLSMLGTLAGSVGALLLTRFMTSLLFGVSSTDPTVFTTICSALLAVTAFACWMPALRATRVDPMIALRDE
jgi:putative ABC transport system permease protein